MTQGLFQFNNSIINEILNFATSTFELFFMSGPKGSSKSEAISKAIPQLEEDNLVFQHFCFDNTVIDDFLLNFYDALRNFSISQKISVKKVATENFKEKVSHHFKTINANCIIIIENFEKVETNVEIVDFLSHLASFENVKIIVVSRNADKNLFRFKKVKMKTFEINEITKEEFKSKLTVLADFVDDATKERFFEITKGLELYLKMGIKYSTVTGITIKDLVYEFERKNTALKIDFEEFIIAKFASLIPGIYKNFFKTLCTFSHPVSTDFLQYYNLGNPSHIEYLAKNFLVSFFKKEVYVKDYFRQYILNSFSIQEKIAYYKKLIEIYENELTKSPKDRLLRLSRESIRKEIDYFNSIIPSVNSNKDQKTLTYLGFSKPDWNKPQSEKPKFSFGEKLNKIKERKKLLSKEENDLLISKRLEETSQKSLIDENKEKNRLFIIKLINSSRELNENYRFQAAIDELKRAQTIDYDNEFKIEILTLTAKNYEALNEFSLAKKSYEEALAYAKETKDTRALEICFLIASVNKNSYKINLAKEQFSKIALNENHRQNYRARAYLELGEIEEADSNINEAIKDYQEALNLVIGKNKELTSKCYYKLAILYDENQDTQNAIKYYQKNYTTCAERKDNKYYSACLVNLALIVIEQGNYKSASEYLKLALQFDSEVNDYENMYFSQKELGKLYSKIDKTSAVGYFKEALNSAQKLNDSFKEALVYFEVSELYYDSQDDEKALINLLNSKKILGNSDSENIQRIESRINDIKMRLDKVSFDLIVDKYAKQTS